MIICSHCHQDNRSGAFYCKHCCRVLACPRCRVILDEPADFCDNCGQALTSDDIFQIERPSQVQKSPLVETVIDSESIQIESRPAEGRTTSVSTKSRLTSDLGRFVPSEMIAKLEAVPRSGEMVGERRPDVKALLSESVVNG